jgi:hypothetical protein
MLKKQTTGFIDYCKVTDFSSKSIESLTISLREFSTFVFIASDVFHRDRADNLPGSPPTHLTPRNTRNL